MTSGTVSVRDITSDCIDVELFSRFFPSRRLFIHMILLQDFGAQRVRVWAWEPPAVRDAHVYPIGPRFSGFF